MQKERLLGKKEIYKNGKAIQMEKMTYGMLSKYRTELMGIAAVSVLITHASDTIVVSDMPFFFRCCRKLEHWLALKCICSSLYQEWARGFLMRKTRTQLYTGKTEQKEQLFHICYCPLLPM